MNVMKCIYSVVMLCVYPSIAWGEREWPITGIYTDLSFHKITGDVLGTEIIIGYSNKGYWAIFQYSEGEPSIPVIVPLNVSGNNISFNLPTNTYDRGRFDGEILQGGWLIGEFERNKQKLKLRRKNSYWQYR
ncbi:hypothetical protein F9N87_13535 [Salmonella enterica]|nr:hypothetical protein [Salmonella enterica]